MQQDRNKHRETEDTENTDLVVLIVTSGGGWRVSASSCHLLTRVARMGRGVARTNNASLWLFEGERFAPRFLITVSQCFNIAVGFPIQKKQRNTETRRHGDTETRRHGDTETRRHGDTETRRHGDTESTDPVFCPFLKRPSCSPF
jgi:hypothetical protein